MMATEGMTTIGGSAKWTDELHSFFYELCAVEVIKGNKENSKYGKFRNKDLSLYMRYYDTLFGDIVATGERVKTTNTYYDTLFGDGHDFTEVLGEIDDGKEGSGDSDDNNTQTPPIFPSSSLKFGRSSGSKRKQSGAESLRAGLDGLVDVLSCRSTSLTATTEEASLN